MRGEINQMHLKRLKQYGAQVGAGCLAIHLACNGCLETESLRGSSQGQHHLYSDTGWEEIGLSQGEVDEGRRRSRWRKLKVTVE